MLVAFKYADDAFNGSYNSSVLIRVGGSMPLDTFGPNVVVVNEITDQNFSIPEAIIDFNYSPSVGVVTTTTVGKIIIADRIEAYSFLNFLKSDVLGYFNNDLSSDDFLMSLSHVTFMLKTTFMLDDGETGKQNTVNINPFFFNIDSIESVCSPGEITPHAHVIHAIGVVNTLGLLNSFSSIHQLDITHKDGDRNTIPKGTGTKIGLNSWEEDNSSNAIQRKNRLQQAKPMMTLKDVFDGLQADLNQLTYPHRGQLQSWLRTVRDNRTDNIIVTPKQKKKPLNDKLPIEYVIDLDKVYQSYPVDNRNMPFEQSDVKQNLNGMVSFPVSPGTYLIDLIPHIMMLSKKVGIDASLERPKTFKVTITAIHKKTDRYVINIKIRQYELPINWYKHGTTPQKDVIVDTGPIQDDKILHFFINDPQERDVDVTELKSHINYYNTGDDMLEHQTDNISAEIVYGDREAATVERSVNLSFFQTLYSGLRSTIGANKINGLQSAERLGNILNLIDKNVYPQSTHNEMVIMGNPYLMSDVNRNPKEVVEDAPGNVKYYAKPETDPMYVKLTIFENNVKPNEGSPNPVLNKFYFDAHYHVIRVVSMFGGTDKARSFYQYLVLQRNDTLV
jgi:hypothetical protein